MPSALTIADACRLLESIAPCALAEEWDNVGLLVGDPAAPLRVVLTCLTLTPDVVDEAIARSASLVVAHHPLPFRGVKAITTESVDGGSLWRLAAAGVAVYSPHTAYDSAAVGVNQQWADRLGLTATRPLCPAPDRTDGAGVGRLGQWSAGDFGGLVDRVKQLTNQPGLRVVSPGDASNSGRCATVAIACGSGGSLLDLAVNAGCDVFLTGEMSFHECLRCRSLGVGVILTGHYASERFAVETLADRLRAGLPGVEATASRVEADPLTPV
jgi:dinuclear metal center YbgI/SA1388 family protein